MPVLPTPRGPLTRALLPALLDLPGTLPELHLGHVADPLGDEDLHLALYCCYELHYRGLDGVDEAWEWDPDLLRLRGELEAAFEQGLRDAVGSYEEDAPVDASRMDLLLREVGDNVEAPSVSKHIAREGTREQLEELLVHRSAFQLKEADAHTWAIPRLVGGPKGAMVEIQADEYGGGRPERIHAQLFADTLDGLGMDSTYGAYLDRLPGLTLATVNLVSMCGLHRRLRGAIVGHLALYEMQSAVPSRRYVEGLRRLGVEDPAVLEFFEEHVAADAVHEAVAAVDMAGGLARQDPALGPQVLWGARALAHLDARQATELMDAWEAGRSSLLDVVAVAA